MSARISIKILSTVLLAAIAALAAYTMDSPPSPVKSAAENRDTINIAPYIYGKMPPILLGEIKNPDAYVHLKFRFRADSTESYPNVFQTAPINRGMRMEISGSTAAIIVPDSSVPGGLMGLTVTTALKTGQWYALEVEALNSAFVRVTLDGHRVVDYASAELSMDTSQLLLGGGLGFDPPRIFRGQIENISVTKGNHPQSWVTLSSTISLSQWMLIFLCGIAFLMSLPRDSITEVADGGDATPIISGLVDNIAIYGFSLVFVAVGLFSIRLLGEQYLGLSKWIAHIMLSVSLAAILLIIKRQRNVWKWARWPLSVVFLAYAASIVGSIGYKEHAYDVFILAMFIFSPLAFGLSLARTGWSSPLSQRGRMRLTLGVSMGISGLFLALSWSALVDLTNWQAFKQTLDNNFGVVVVGAFLILRTVFAILFGSYNSTQIIVTTGLCVRGKVKYFASRSYLDIAVIAVFFWISFRQDSLFIPGSEFHWEYYVGVVQGVRNGGWLLWDTPSQYGFLNILLASLVPSASAWQAFYLFQGTLLFLVSTGIYLAARRYTSRSVFHRLVVFAIVFMALFFADPELIGPYPFPSSSVVRFFCVYALVLVAWFIPKFGLRQAIALSIVWSLAVIWSAESAIYGTAILLFILAALLQTRTAESNSFALAGKYVAIAAMCLALVIVVMFAFYMARLGMAPDLFGFFEHALGYAGGFGYVPFPLTGPGNLLLLVFMGVSILCIGAIQRGGDANDLVSPLAAMAGCIWGISTYYIGRPVPQNITAMLPLVAMVVYLTLVLSKRMGQEAYSLPIKATALPLIFLVLIPLTNIKWIENLFEIRSFASNVITKLPKASDELQQLVSRAKPSADTPIVYYGDDAAPPILSGEYARLNETNWLPIPLQLLEPPMSEARRSLYLNRYICRNQPSGGILVNRKGNAIAVRLQGFLHELRQFYDVEEVISGNVYVLYRFSGINLQHCLTAVGKKIS